MKILHFFYINNSLFKGRVKTEVSLTIAEEIFFHFQEIEIAKSGKKGSGKKGTKGIAARASTAPKVRRSSTINSGISAAGEQSALDTSLSNNGESAGESVTPPALPPSVHPPRTGGKHLSQMNSSTSQTQVGDFNLKV